MDYKRLKKFMVLRFAILIIFINITVCNAQMKKPDLFVESGTFISGGRNTPFWLLSNQYGKYSNNTFNITYSAGAKALFDTSRNIDYGYGVELFNRIDGKYNLYPHELYMAFKLWFFDIHFGWREETYGNAYQPLTMGNLLWSGNARPMPKISINIPEFTPVPFTKGFLEFKGNLAHGWFENDRYVKHVYMHHKSLIGRIGGKWPVNFSYGLHHFAQWGGDSPDYGHLPSSFKDFITIFKADSTSDNYNVSGENINRLGNHIGSRNFGLDIKTKKFNMGLYMQTVFEDSSGEAWRNIKDGFWGIFWENKKVEALIHAVLFEFLNTTDQSGPLHDYYIGDSLVVLGGDDNYFNNYIYMDGWTYYDNTICTPLITSNIYDSKTVKTLPNNKVEAYHFAIDGKIWDGQYKLLINYNKNYGLHKARYIPPRENICMLASYALFSEKLNGMFCFDLGLDFGKMYGNNLGLKITYKREFNL